MSSFLSSIKISEKLLLFNNTNYQEWANILKGFIYFFGIWFIIKGYSSTTMAPISSLFWLSLITSPDNSDKIATWNDKNDKTLNLIQMHIASNLKHYINNANDTSVAWKTLTDVYKKPRAVSAYIAFQKLFNTALTDIKALMPQINAMIKACAHVNDAGIIVSK